MFISNIIFKLLAIIYKPRIICKGYNSPYKQGPTTILNYIKYRFHRTLYARSSPTQDTSNKPMPLSLSRSYECFTFLTHILTWALESFVLQVPPPVKGISPSQRVMFGTLLNHINLDVSQFQILVRKFGAHREATVKNTLRPLVNSLSFIHG